MQKLTVKEAGGMTVNERLFVAGLLGDFDKAVAERDELALRRVLQQVYLSSENIAAIVLHIMNQPLSAA